MYIYIPGDMPEIEIHYEVFPGDMIYPDEIEIQKVLINGKEVSLKLESHLVEFFDIENKIKEGLKCQ